jgi:hypothetical protein
MKRLCRKLPRRAVVSYRNNLRTLWEWIPIMLSIYNAILIPLEISFAVSYDFLQLNEKVNMVLDVLFLVDNILMFFTSYLDELGEEVWDPYKIYLRYTRTWRFVFDCLSLLGNTYFKHINSRFKYF